MIAKESREALGRVILCIWIFESCAQGKYWDDTDIFVIIPLSEANFKKKIEQHYVFHSVQSISNMLAE